MMELRPKNTLRRPEKLVNLYGYGKNVPDYAKTSFKVNRRKRRKCHADEQQSPQQPTNNIYCAETVHSDEPVASTEQALALHAYMERGKEKLIHLYAVRAVYSDGQEPELYVRGDTLEIKQSSGHVHIGELQDILLRVSCGTQIILYIRPYHMCTDFDEYVVNSQRIYREFCIESPYDKIRINATDAISIRKLIVNPVTDCVNADVGIVLKRAFIHSSESWCSVNECLRQEALQRHTAAIPTETNSNNESESESEIEDDEAMPPDICLLKHAFESDFGTRGFVDFLCDAVKQSADKMEFMEHINAQYLYPVEQVGATGNVLGQSLFRRLVFQKNFHILDKTPAKTETCCLCRQVTLCSYMISCDSGSLIGPVSKGCAKRLRRATDLSSFLHRHEDKYKELNRDSVIELHVQLQQLLHDIDRSLKRPERLPLED